MKRLYSKRSVGIVSGTLHVIGAALLVFVVAPVSPASAQAVLFDFDNAPLQTSFPIDQTADGITAHFAATGQGYSIQNANTMGFTPPGFAGRCIYPSSVFLADLLVRFDQPLTDFSIMYACQELGCDDAALMRVTVYRNGTFVGTNTKTASFPGTWPVDTLSCSFPLGFDSVVVHYDSPPPTCQDYGVIFLADNMWVTPLSSTSIRDGGTGFEGIIVPNPISSSSTISFSLLRPEHVMVTLYDLNGSLVAKLFDGRLNTGEVRMPWATDDTVANGVYVLDLAGEHFSRSYKVVVLE